MGDPSFCSRANALLEIWGFPPRRGVRLGGPSLCKSFCGGSGWRGAGPSGQSASCPAASAAAVPRPGLASEIKGGLGSVP